jgi:gliotoxin/aspirochlorine biosynthesis peptide synthetase
MYKTGDRAYWNEAGELVCLGRIDRQIKLRGFRLDMNDLEICVSRAVAGLHSVAFAPKDDFLIAVVQPSSLDLTSVRSQIATVLPVHARPRHIVLVDKFPMTPAGKLDYKAITSDHFMRISEDNDNLDTPTETKVSAIWRKLLKLDRNQHLSPKSNFLELGGHSLLQMILAARLASTFKTKIPPRVVIDAMCLRDLASELDKLRSFAAPQSPSKTLGTHGLSPMELEWYGKYKSNPDSSAFNVSFVAELSTGLIDRNRLTKAWNTVLNRHAIFRGRYISCRGSTVERRYADSAPRVQQVHELDLRTEANRPFDLASSSPVRVFLTTKVLVVVMNHIVADLTTLQIILSEVRALYMDEQLRPVAHTYEDSAVWADEPPRCDLSFWTRYLADLPPRQVGNGCLRERSGYRGTSKVYELSGALASKMLAFALAKNVSLQQLAMAAVALALQSASTTTDIVLGSPFINRSTDADLDTVGLFLQPLPIRVKYGHGQNDDEASRSSFLQCVQESSQAALGHAVLWQKLLEQLNVPQDPLNNPLFDVMVTFHDSERGVKLDLPGLHPCLTWSEGSKFPLMAEFTALKTGKVILRVEADDELYPAGVVDEIVADISKAFEMLISESPYPAMKASVRQAGVERGVYPLLKKDVFGARLDEL